MQSISQKGWDKYLDRKAAEFLATQQVIKSHPVAGGGGQAPGFLVLRQRGEQWATQYSELALKACKLLNAGKLSELRKLVEATPAASSPAQSGVLKIAEYTPAFDRRITQLNQNANSASASLNQNVQQLLAQIASENQAAQQRDADLNQARISAAQNRGAANALAIFQAEQKAQNEVLAQLRASQLGGLE